MSCRRVHSLWRSWGDQTSLHRSPLLLELVSLPHPLARLKRGHSLAPLSLCSLGVLLPASQPARLPLSLPCSLSLASASFPLSPLSLASFSRLLLLYRRSPSLSPPASLALASVHPSAFLPPSLASGLLTCTARAFSFDPLRASPFYKEFFHLDTPHPPCPPSLGAFCMGIFQENQRFELGVKNHSGCACPRCRPFTALL